VTPRLVFRPEAESELLDARVWYDDQQPGLGQAFAAEVDGVLMAIVEHPLAYPASAAKRALVHRFPYAIYSRVMFDGRRLPHRWRSRR
jgi:hypothetical protein